MLFSQSSLYTNGKEVSSQLFYHWGIFLSFEEGVPKMKLLKEQNPTASNSKAFRDCSVPNSITWPSGMPLHVLQKRSVVKYLDIVSSNFPEWDEWQHSGFAWSCSTAHKSSWWKVTTLLCHHMLPSRRGWRNEIAYETIQAFCLT